MLAQTAGLCAMIWQYQIDCCGRPRLHSSAWRSRVKVSSWDKRSPPPHCLAPALLSRRIRFLFCSSAAITRAVLPYPSRTVRSAPSASNCLTAVAFPFWTAKIRAVRPSSLLKLTSAPRLRSKSVVLERFLYTAAISDVHPEELVWLMSAPASINSSTVSG